jgi:hypothetical protein
MAVVVDGGEGGGGRGHGGGGGREGSGKGGCEGGGQGGREGAGRGVLIFDQLLISLHISQTIILTISYLQANHILCNDEFFFHTFYLSTSKPTISFATMCFFGTYYLS